MTCVMHILVITFRPISVLDVINVLLWYFMNEFYLTWVHFCVAYSKYISCAIWCFKNSCLIKINQCNLLETDILSNCGNVWMNNGGGVWINYNGNLWMNHGDMWMNHDSVVWMNHDSNNMWIIYVCDLWMNHNSHVWMN